MNRTIIIEKLRHIIEPYVQNKDELDNFSEETRFIKDLKINSAHLVDVFIDAEDEFDIIIDNDALENVQNTGDVIDLVQKKLAEKE